MSRLRGTKRWTKYPAPEPLPVMCENEENQDILQKSQEEICWCIKKLELNLSSKDMTPRQAEQSLKTLKTLKSKTAPLVKKRQAMRLTLGDYRKTMMEEAKQCRIDTNLMKITAMKTHGDSKLLKVHKLQTHTSEEFMTTEKESNEIKVTRVPSFYFNFSSPEEIVIK